MDSQGADRESAQRPIEPARSSAHCRCHSRCRTKSASQSEAKDVTAREQADAERLTPEVLVAVKDLWDTIEFNLRHEPANPGRRRCARGWGVIYATRPGETPDPQDPPATGGPGTAPANPPQ